MYAVIEASGKQFRVAPGDSIKVDTLPGEVGSEMEFGRVIALVNDSNELLSGSDLEHAKVKVQIETHDRGEKILVFKFKRKKQYRRTIGHRQNYTQVRISEISI
jgi:large subunit ribosomal protein L21